MGVLCAAFLFSCSNEMEEMNQNEAAVPTVENIQKLDAATAQQTFAVILSKAVYGSQELRNFIRTEALKQFDRDYDVFYPFVKDTKVCGERTFRDVILDYTDERTLASIEASLPRLNILVPDLSFVDAFCADNWDTSSNEVAVSYATGNDEHVLYANGEVTAKLEVGELPAFPLLVVKENERMSYRPSTRGISDLSAYDFADPVFNGSAYNKPQTRATDWDLYPEQESTEPYVPVSVLDASVIEAYNENKKNPSSLDRDYIYYGLSSSHPTYGTLNTNINEAIYKFKLSNSVYYSIADADTDPKLKSDVENKVSELPLEQVWQKIWTDGAFEFNFYSYIYSKSDKTKPSFKKVPVKAQDLFQYDKVHVHRRHKTAFRHTNYTYVIEAASLKPKWVNIKDQIGSNIDIFTTQWDLSDLSLNIYVNVKEVDPSLITEEKHTGEFTQTVSTDFATEKIASTKAANNFLMKVSGGFSSTHTTTDEFSLTKTEEDDDLGDAYINYTDPIILDDSEKDTKGYKIYTYSTGSVEFMVLPVAKR